MRERKRIRVKGENLPVMTMKIERVYYPPAPPKIKFPPAPKEIKAQGKAAIQKWMGETSGKVDEANATAWEKWLKERVPDTHIRIEFMSWAWEGRLLGEIGGKHVGEIQLGLINGTLQLCLPDGQKIDGRAEDLPPEKVLANKAILDSETVPVSRLDEESRADIQSMKKTVETHMKGVSEMGYRLDLATQDPMEYKLYLTRNLNLTTQEQQIYEALKQYNGDTSKASRALITLHGKKSKGFSQGNVWKIKKKLENKIGTLTGRTPRVIFSTLETDAWGRDEWGHKGPIK